jgi:hypothetical protein
MRRRIYELVFTMKDYSGSMIQDEDEGCMIYDFGLKILDVLKEFWM